MKYTLLFTVFFMLLNTFTFLQPSQLIGKLLYPFSFPGFTLIGVY